MTRHATSGIKPRDNISTHADILSGQRLAAMIRKRAKDVSRWVSEERGQRHYSMEVGGYIFVSMGWIPSIVRLAKNLLLASEV